MGDQSHDQPFADPTFGTPIFATSPLTTAPLTASHKFAKSVGTTIFISPFALASAASGSNASSSSNVPA